MTTTEEIERSRGRSELFRRWRRREAKDPRGRRGWGADSGEMLLCPFAFKGCRWEYVGTVPLDFPPSLASEHLESDHPDEMRLAREFPGEMHPAFELRPYR